MNDEQRERAMALLEKSESRTVVRSANGRARSSAFVGAADDRPLHVHGSERPARATSEPRVFTMHCFFG